MSMVSNLRPTSSFGLLKNISFTESELGSLALIGVALPILAVSCISLHLGTLLMEIGFPLLALRMFLARTGDTFAPAAFFPGIFMLWYWVGNIPVLAYDRSASTLSGATDEVWLYCALGLVAYLCGTLVIRDEGMRATSLRGIRGQWQDDHTLLLLLFVAVGVLLTWTSISVSEGIAIFSPEVDTLRVEIPERHRLAYQAMVSLSNLFSPFSYLYLQTSNKPRFRRSINAFSVFALFVLISTGNRGLVLTPILTIFALRHYLRKPWSFKFVFVAGLVILPLLSISGYYRSLQHYGPTYVLDLADMGIPVALQPFTNVYLYLRAPNETLRNVLGVIPAVTPFQHGAISFGFLQQLLPGRHPSSDFFFKELLGHSFAGLGEPASIIGTFYADGGGLVIAIGMFLTGMLTKFAYVRMFRGSIGWVLVYCFIWQKLIGSLYGSLITYVIEFILPVGWLFLSWALTNGTRPRPVGLRSEAELR